MTQDFMKNAPVGTKIFNKKNKLHYVKVEKDGTSFWKVQRGSRVGRLTIGNTSTDNYGTALEYVEPNKQELRVKHSGDNIADYLQTRGFTEKNRNKFYTSDRDIVVRDGKYFTSDGKEIPKHEIQKGKIYHIEGDNTVIGKQLTSELNKSKELEKYNLGKTKYDQSTYLINRWSQRPGDTYFSSRKGSSGSTYAEAVETEKKNRQKYSKYSVPFNEYYENEILGKKKSNMEKDKEKILGETPPVKTPPVQVNGKDVKSNKQKLVITNELVKGLTLE